MTQCDALFAVLACIVVDDFGAEAAPDFFAVRRGVAQGLRRRIGPPFEIGRCLCDVASRYRLPLGLVGIQ